MNKKEIGKKIVYASEMFVPFKYLQIFNLSTGSIRSSYNASHYSGLRTMNHEPWNVDLSNNKLKLD